MNEEINNRIDDALYNFYLETNQQTINDLLKNDIKDLDDYYKKKKQLIFLSRAAVNKKHNEDLLAIAAKIHKAIEQNIERPVALLKRLLQGNSSLALYSNLYKLTNEDIIEIIKDNNLLEIMEELDKDVK